MSARFSRCRCYRYALWRCWGAGGQVLFVMLNPSTADARDDDPTIRRCSALARDWGFGSLAVANLFAFRATRPAVLKRASDPVGPRNDGWIARLCGEADLVVAAWGNHGAYAGRAARVRSTLSRPHHLGLNKTGEPAHPLYRPRHTRPREWEPLT
ncbi:MAG: DUF1643 domain-containing protein [Gammaproteobacteria bacterium]